MRRRLAQVERQIRNVTDTIADMGPVPELKERLAIACAEKAKLESELRQAPAPIDVARVVREAKARLHQQVQELDEALESDVARARAVFTELFGRLVVEHHPDAVTVRATNPEPQTKTPSPSDSASSQLIVVAGAGFEPATFGL